MSLRNLPMTVNRLHDQLSVYISAKAKPSMLRFVVKVAGSLSVSLKMTALPLLSMPIRAKVRPCFISSAGMKIVRVPLFRE